MVLCFACLGVISTAQQGGSATYQFLDLESSARIAAMGGSYVTVFDDDVNLAVYNPSLLNPSMGGSMALNYVNYFSDINYGFASYAHDVEDVGTFSASLLFLDYGKFKRTDELGTELGQFRAGEYALVFGGGRRIDSLFTVGANLKLINSVLDQWSSYGAALDLSATYYKKSKEFLATLIIRNAGIQFKPYRDDNREPLPFEIMLGISKRLKHAPFRLSLTLNDLQTWDLTYRDPSQEPEIDPITQEPIPIEEPGFLDKMMRHVVVGVEMMPKNENLHINFGFNYRRRQELKLENRPGMIGMSVGAGFKISKFMLSYGFSRYHRAAGSHHISVISRLGEWRTKN